MRAASDKLIALLDANQFIMADLYTITTVQGDVIRATSYDFDLIVEGYTYFSSGEIIQREGISLSIGIEVDNLSITINALDENTIGGIPIVQAFHNGQMDGDLSLSEFLWMIIHQQIPVLVRLNCLKGESLNQSLIVISSKLVLPLILMN